MTIVLDVLNEINQSERFVILDALDEIVTKTTSLVKIYVAADEN